MAKARQAAAPSALDELLLNQSAALARSQQPEKAGAPEIAKPAPSATKPSASPRPCPQQPDGGKPASEDIEILYAKVPGSVLRAMKLHLVFNEDPEIRNIKDLLVKTLTKCFSEELEEVRKRSAGR